MGFLKTSGISIGAWVGSLCLFVLGGIGVFALLSDGGDFHQDAYGVGRSGGQLTLFQCAGDGVGLVQVQVGDSIESPVEWSAHLRAGTVPVSRLPLLKPTTGYRVVNRDEPRVRNAPTLTILQLEDGRGFPIGASVMTFDRADIREGTIQTGEGKRRTLTRWLAHRPNC